MKRNSIQLHFTIWLLMLVSIASFNRCYGQQINAAYVKALYAKYPVAKSDFCTACKLWVNPYYTSIADTIKNYPVLETAIVTAQNVQDQENANVPRSGVYAKWNVPIGMQKLNAVYSYANKQINQPMGVNEVVYGHCALAWILAARDINGAIISNTERYGEFMEYQGQNVGTMINTEDTCRMLLGATIHKVKYPIKTQSIQIWAGCVSSNTSKVYSVNGKSVTVPDVVWKVLKFNNETIVYWMPNIATEVQALTSKRHITYQELIDRLGFDPCIELPVCN